MGPIRFLPLTLACALLAGCANQFSPAMEDRKTVIQTLEGQYSGAQLASNIANVTTEEARNQRIVGRLALIDARYYQFAEQLLVNQQGRNILFDMSGVALGIAGTTLGGESTSQAMSGISGSLSGARTALDWGLLVDKTLSALVTAMDAARKEALLPILRGMDANLADYPMAQAIAHLNAYEHAGTLLSGLDTLQAAAVREADAAERTIRAEGYDLSPEALAAFRTLIGRAGALCDDQIRALLADDAFVAELRKYEGADLVLEEATLAEARRAIAEDQREYLKAALVSTPPGATPNRILAAHFAAAEALCPTPAASGDAQ